MVLVHLTINGGLSLFMTVLEDRLLHNGGGDLFMDCGVMVTCLLPERETSNQHGPLVQVMTRAITSTVGMADRLRVYCLHEGIK